MSLIAWIYDENSEAWVRQKSAQWEGDDLKTFLSGDWDAVPKNALLFLVTSREVHGAGALFTALRTRVKPESPIVWVAEKPLSEAETNRIVDAGADDFSTFEELKVRLKARSRNAENVIALEKKSQDLELKLAKTETTIKQREEFLSVCAHDLRSPLGLIQTSLSMVLNAGNLSQMQSELVTRARRQSGQAIKLVNDLLDVMALEQGLKPQYQVINVHDLLGEFYQDYQLQAAQKKIRFHYKNEIKDWRILADADRIRQLLQNLFGNALKFTEKGKNIYLEVTPFQGRRRTDPAYPMIVMSLRDEGKGIPTSESQKIFDRFSQLKQNSRADGRGLGLTVAKQISNLHDGNIWVQSAEGQGSTFFVLFPHVLSHPMPSSHKKLVLIAEPSFQRRDGYYSQLRDWGYELIFARDGVEAVTLSFHRVPHLVILSPELTKLKEGDIVNILKQDPLTKNTSVLIAGEPAQLAKSDVTLFDESLPLPFTKEGFEATLLSLKDRLLLAA